MSTPAERLARILAELKARGISQREVAKKLNTRPQYVSDIKAGRCTLSPAFAFRMASAFQVDPDWLLRGEGKPWRKTEERTEPPPSVQLRAVMLPLLECVVPGDPSVALEWSGARHPVPEEQARPCTPDAHRYVLRVSADDVCEDLKEGDYMLIENRLGLSPDAVIGRLCAVRTGAVQTLEMIHRHGKSGSLRVGRSSRGRTRGGKIELADVLGVCLRIIWRCAV